MRARLLLRESPDFRRLLGSSTVSLLGSSTTAVALPLTAVTVLQASPWQMGLLSAGGLLPNLLFALPAGVWLSRRPLRRVLVATDLAQAVLSAAVPVLAVLDVLRLWQLGVVVVLAGTCSLFDAVAAESLTPAVVPRADLLTANGLRALSSSTVGTSGNAVAGLLVSLLTAPLALLVDAVSFVVSALWRRRLTVDGRTASSGPVEREPLRRLAARGVTVLWREPALRWTTLAATAGALAGAVQNVVLVLFLARELHLPDVGVGLVVAVAGAAGIVGALVGPAVTTRCGSGRTFLLGMLLTGLAGLVLAAATGPWAVVVALLVAGQALRGVGPAFFGMNQQTLRQTLVPAEHLPQALATWRLLVHGVQPVGALVGGVLGAAVGLRWTLVAGSVLLLLATAAATRPLVGPPPRR
ncbi:MFS transporter [Kineococcus endophyticus]|uniref:MFS transporter n=1 Tax=Kineococcus endophyticus TaxID=1181883 RepID=A0ABV3PDJ8_9ACTN